MADWSRNTPWRQGHLLPDEALSTIGLSHQQNLSGIVVIVATHDCDLAQLPDKEPYVEVIIGRQILKLDGNFTHAKDPRTLHLDFEGSEPFFAEFVIVEKRSISKNSLAAFKPKKNAKLSRKGVVIFQLWLASRYRRDAFPDEFEKRLKKAKLHEKIANALKTHGELITAIFFDLDDGKEIARTGPDDTYLLDIYLLHTTQPDFFAAENAAKEAKEKIETAFRNKLFDSESYSWREIELRYLEIISEEAMTFYQSQYLRKWRLHHISLSADPQHPVVKE